MWEGISWHLWNCHCCTLETCPSVPDPARAVSSFLPLRSRFAVPHAVHGKGAAGAIRYFIPGGWWHLRGPPSQLWMPRFRHSRSMNPPFRYLQTLFRFHWASFSRGWTVTALSPCPHRRGTPRPWWSWWPYAGPLPAHTCLSLLRVSPLPPDMTQWWCTSAQAIGRNFLTMKGCSMVVLRNWREKEKKELISTGS